MPKISWKNLTDLNDGICFAIHLYLKEREICDRALFCLRKFFPKNPIILISEADHKYAIKLAIKYSCHYQRGFRLKTIRYGGLWTKRYFEIYLKYYSKNYPLLCRLDPDTIVWRRFKFDIDTEQVWSNSDIFGTISTSNFPYRMVRGGCIFFWDTTVEFILESSQLMLAKYKDKEVFGYQRYASTNKWDHEAYSEEYLAVQDKIIAVIAHESNLKLGDYPDVFIAYRQIPSGISLSKYAATHPHPLPDLKPHGWIYF